MWKITKRFLSLALIMVVVIGCFAMTTACKMPEYTITYEMDGGTNHAENPDKFTEKDLPLTIKNPTKEGYDFVGWTCTQLNYFEKDTDVIVILGTLENITFTAVWKEAVALETGEYKIVYNNLNGANNEVNPEKYKSDTDNLPLTIQPISRGEEFEFLGWSSEFSAKPQQTVVIPVGTKKTLTLVANWTRIKAPANYGDDKKKATDFSVTDIHGKYIESIIEEFVGKKPIFISFWEYNCDYCKKEMRESFNPVYLEMKDEFELLAIHVAGRAQLNNHLDSAGVKYEFPIFDDAFKEAINPPGCDSRTTYKQGSAVPLNYMIDKWGYLYTPNNISKTSATTSFALGTIESPAQMRAIINAAIIRGEV